MKSHLVIQSACFSMFTRILIEKKAVKLYNIDYWRDRHDSKHDWIRY